jgi:meso-butanediol dehydrogenase / (S,S)-butanediol dehydrogenase / diacetyl reductase
MPTAIVTGAAQGIGRAIALRLAKDGFDVAINDLPRQSDQLESLAQEIREAGRRSCVVAADVTQDSDVQTMILNTVNILDGVDVVSQSRVLHTNHIKIPL